MADELWVAPVAHAPVQAVIRLPGSKSITNRALILAALAEGPGRIRSPLKAVDTELMAAALRALGAEVEQAGADWLVTPGPLLGPADIDCGLAGTVMRFLPPVAVLAKGDIRLDGVPRARQRPMSPILTGLRALGARIDDEGRGGLPLLIHGEGGLAGGVVTLDASSSSQFVSGLLLAAPRYELGVQLSHVGPPVPSLPHIDMTLSMLEERGVAAVAESSTRWRVEPGPLRAVDSVVEPDLSNAAPFLAAALVTGGQVTIPGWPEATEQPGSRLPAMFTAMGATTTQDASGLTLSGSGAVGGGDWDLREVGELTPVVAAVAALADAPSRLRGIAHLRGHETNRLAALAAQINGLGGDVREHEDGLEIRPRPLHGGLFATYDDHRMATAAAVLGLLVEGVKVENVATTAKTLPDFVDLWTAMLGGGR